MNLKVIQGDDAINELCMASMNSVIITLWREKIITDEQAKDFLDNHLCLLAQANGGFGSWFKRLFKPETTGMVLCAKVQVQEKMHETL